VRIRCGRKVSAFLCHCHARPPERHGNPDSKDLSDAGVADLQEERFGVFDGIAFAQGVAREQNFFLGREADRFCCRRTEIAANKDAAECSSSGPRIPFAVGLHTRLAIVPIESLQILRCGPEPFPSFLLLLLILPFGDPPGESVATLIDSYLLGFASAEFYTS